MTRRSSSACRPSTGWRESIRELLDPAIGLEAGLFGKLRHLVEKPLLAVEEGSRGLIPSSVRWSPWCGLHLGVGFSGESFLGEGGSFVVRLQLICEQVERCRSGWLPESDCSHCFLTVLRWTASVLAKASIEENRRCCRPVISRPEALCVRLFLPPALLARARYWSSKAAIRSSGESAGRPEISTCTTWRFGNPPTISRSHP
jgi:hypothetical protein